MTHLEGPDCFSLSITWDKAEGNEMGAWFSQEPGMDTLEESQQDAAMVQR